MEHQAPAEAPGEQVSGHGHLSCRTQKSQFKMHTVPLLLHHLLFLSADL